MDLQKRIINIEKEVVKKIALAGVKFNYIGLSGDMRNHKGVIVIASFITDTYPNVVYYGAAFCSPKDKFDKNKGKMMAYDRLIREENIAFYRKKKHADIATRILGAILVTGGCPVWADDMIKRDMTLRMCRSLF
jgi:hypothetical protein